MNSNYIRGARLERIARASLQRQGDDVLRSAGKGAVDLAAFKEDDILLVQVKASRVTPADRRTLAAFKGPSTAGKQFRIRSSEGWETQAVDVAEPKAINHQSSLSTEAEGELTHVL